MILIERVTLKGSLLGFNHDGNLVARECTKCKEYLPYDSFHKNSKTEFGIGNVCKCCRAKELASKPKKRKRYYKLDENNELIERQCTICLVIKQSSHFNKHAASVGNRSVICRDCSKIEGKIYKLQNVDKIKKGQRDYYKSNIEKVKKNVKKWRSKNKDKVRATDKRICRTQIINNIFKKQLHEIRKTIKKSKMVMDHIIPLKHRDVCGLNVPWNIQILSHSVNCSKSNKFDGTYENESWRLDL